MTERSATASGWQLRGNAAEAYEAYLVPVIFEAHAQRLIEAAGVQAGDRVLDAACGTGVVSRAAAQRVGPTGVVTAVDLNPDMLATAQIVGADVTPAIEFHQADVVALPFDDEQFDVTLCQEAMQFFSDRVSALKEMRRVTTSGGRLAFCSFRSLGHHPVYEIFARVLGEFAGPDAATMMSSPFALGDLEELRSCARDAGWDDVQVRISVGSERFPSVDEMVRQEAASSPLAAALADMPTDRQVAMVAALERDLAPWVDDGGVAFHNETHIVTAVNPA